MHSWFVKSGQDISCIFIHVKYYYLFIFFFFCFIQQSPSPYFVIYSNPSFSTGVFRRLKWITLLMQDELCTVPVCVRASMCLCVCVVVQLSHHPCIQSCIVLLFSTTKASQTTRAEIFNVTCFCLTDYEQTTLCLWLYLARLGK